MENGESASPRGVIFKIMGAIVLFLGGLNLMLLWRGGLGVDWSVGGFFGVGLVLMFIGKMRARFGGDGAH